MKTRLQNSGCSIPLRMPPPPQGPSQWCSRWLPIILVLLGVAPAALAQTLVYQGLTNSPLGSATLAVSGNQLTVGNLGNSGQDGVSISADPECMWNTVEFQPLDSSNTLPVGAYVQSQAVGTGNGLNNAVLGTLTETKAGISNYVLSADYSPLGAKTYTVQVYYEGVLMAQATNQSGASFASVNVMGRGKDVGDIITPLSDETGEGPPGVLTLAGGKTGVPYDRLVVAPDNVAGSIVPTAFQIVASHVPSIIITSENESLLYQGLTNTSLGNASIAVKTEGDGVKLALADIGTNGQDGVSIALPGDSTALDVGWDDLDLSNTLPVGAYIQSQIVGTDNGITNGVLGTLTETKAGTNNYVISADFSPVGAKTYTVKAYYQGVLVAQATNQGGASLAVTKGEDDTCDYGGFDGENTYLSLDDSKGNAALIAGQLVTYDHLYITPESVPLPSALTAFQIVASQVPSITINSENESLVYQGLTNTSLGQASIAKERKQKEERKQLMLADLGTNGQDGVSIALPADLTALDVGWDDLDPSNTLPVGAYIQSQLVGTDSGITNGVLGTLTETKEGRSNYVVSADYSPMGVKTYTVQAYYQGVLVAQATNQNGVSLAVAKTMHATSDIIRDSLSCDGPGATVMISGQLVTCDHLYVIPENVRLPSALTAFQIVASQIPAININSENESLIYDGFTNTSLGSASIAYLRNSNSAGAPDLTLADIGTNGQDGVSISCHTDSNCQWNSTVAFQPLDSSNTLPVGAYIQSQAIGIGNGITNGVLGTLTETKVGTGNYDISADYSPLGASSYTVQAYYQGALMAQSTNQNGAAFATVNIMGQGKDLGDIITPLSDEWPDGEGVVLTIRGLARVPCDHLVVTPNDVTNTVLTTALQIVASQVPIITITNETLNVTYQGQNNIALGNATLDVASNQLTVSNIGSSGQDGVSIEDTKNISDAAAKGQATDREIHLNPPDSGNTLPVGTYMQAQLIGTGGGISNGVLGTLTLTKECADCGGSNWLISVDFSPIGASNYLVEATTGKVPPPPRGGTPTESLSLNFSKIDVKYSVALADTGDFPQSFGYSYDPITGEFSISIDFEPYGTISANGTNVVCDHLYVTPQNVSLPFAPAGLQLVASQIPSFTINSENETVPYAGLYFTTLGNATLSLSDSGVTISNLGSTGQDGVGIEDTKNISDAAAKGQASDMEIRMNPPDNDGTLPVGAYLAEQLIGTDNGITNDILGSLILRKIGEGNYGITADFSPTGQNSYEVDETSNTIQLESFQWGAVNGIIAQTTNFPPYLGFAYENTSNSPSLLLDWSTNSASLSGNGTQVVCNHLTVTPDNVSLPGPPTGFQITASQVPSFTLSTVAVSPLVISSLFTPYKWWVNKKMATVWYGTASLQESTDLTTWTDVTNATSPYDVNSPNQDEPAKFYRLVFRP